MNEAAVKFEVTSQVPVWAVIVIVIQMSIAAEHLLDNTLHIVVEVLVET